MVKQGIESGLSLGDTFVGRIIRQVYDKLHVNTNTGAVAKALREGII